MQKYKENKTNRDIFYQELTQERIEYTKKKESNNDKEDGENSDEKTLEETENESNRNFKEVVQNIF